MKFWIMCTRDVAYFFSAPAMLPASFMFVRESERASERGRGRGRACLVYRVYLLGTQNVPNSKQPTKYYSSCALCALCALCAPFAAKPNKINKKSSIRFPNSRTHSALTLSRALGSVFGTVQRLSIRKCWQTATVAVQKEDEKKNCRTRGNGRALKIQK